MKGSVLTFLFCCCFSHLLLAQNELGPDILQKLDAIAIQDVPEKAPGIATAVIRDGEVIYKKYAGFENLKDSTFLDSNSRFNIASNGKQFTALAILSLTDQRKLKLRDDIRKWFPEIYPNIKEKITILSLLNHTSGIRDCYDLWSLQGYTWWKESFSNDDVLALIGRQSDLNFIPESQYLYSNTNYILLAKLIEKISGKTFVEYTNEMFFKLGMPNTSFENDHTKIAGPIAKAYFNFGTWTDYNWIWNVCGDGNIFTTLEDQIQWEKLVQGKGKTSFSRKLINKSQQKIKASKFSNYGYGLEFGTYKNNPYRFHEGATGAWKATTIRFPKKKWSILTMTNTGKAIPSQQTRQMADVLLEIPTEAKYFATQPQAVGPYISDDEIPGTYLTDGDFAFTFEMKNGKIFLKRVGRNDVELERESDNIFHQKFDPAFKQEFTKSASGNLMVTAYYTSHAPYSLTKTKDLDINFNYQQYNGKWENNETGVVIDLNYLNDKDFEVKFGNNEPTKGLLVSPNKMLVDFYSLTLSKDALFLNGDRIKNVRFKRM